MMDRAETLKTLATLRRERTCELIGQLSYDLSQELISYSQKSENNVVDSLSNRYSQAPDAARFQKYHSDIKDNYIQVFLSEELITAVEKELGITTAELRVAIMKPGFSLDWHIDFDRSLRLHCDLNMPSDFCFRVRNVEHTLDKKVGSVYKINTAHYHKVSNCSDTDRYALIGCVGS
jgi:hypothetical protein